MYSHMKEVKIGTGFTTLYTSQSEVGGLVHKTTCFAIMSVIDRQVTAEHLPLAWTKSTPQDEELLMARLEELAIRFSSLRHHTSTEEDSQPQPVANEVN